MWGPRGLRLLGSPCYVQETFHSEGWCKVVGCEFTRSWSFVAWASDFTSLSFSFLICNKRTQRQLSPLFRGE